MLSAASRGSRRCVAVVASTSRRTFISKPSNRSIVSSFSDITPPFDPVSDAPNFGKVNIGLQRAGKLVIMNELLDDGEHPDMTLTMRNQFARNRVHLISLVDALISGGNFTRARKVLVEAYEVTTQEEFTRLRNDYLQEYALKELKDTGTISQALSWLVTSSLEDFKGLPFDPRAFVILLATACRMQDRLRGDNVIHEIYAEYTKQRTSATELFGYEGLLSYHDARRIVSVCMIPEAQLPRSFQLSSAPPAPDITRELDPSSDEPLSVALVKAQSEAVKNILSQIPASVQKTGFEELNPVDSIGIKLLRSSLKGIAESEKPVLPVYGKADKGESEADDGFLNFEAQLSLLPEDQQAQYREAFEIYNQQRQRLLEALALESARERWKYDYEQMLARGDMSVTNVNEYLWEWQQAMTQQVEQEFAEIDRLLDAKNEKPSGSGKIEFVLHVFL